MNATWRAQLHELLEQPTPSTLAAILTLLDEHLADPDADEATALAERRIEAWPLSARVLPTETVRGFLAWPADHLALRLGRVLDLRALVSWTTRPPTELLPPMHFPQRLVQVQRRGIGPSELAALVASPGFCQLRGLSLAAQHSLDDAALTALFEAPAASSLTHLQLENQRCTAAAARALAASPHLRALTHLIWRYTPLGPDGARALATAPGLTGLQVLDLTATGIGDDGAEAIARAPWPHLRVLELESAGVADRGAQALATRSPGLQLLRFGDSALGDAGLAPLLRSPALATLHTLDVWQGRATVASVEALAASPHLGALTTLRLAGAPLGDQAVEALATSPHRAQLRALALDGHGLTTASASSFAALPLTTLHIGHNRLEEQGLAILASSPTLASLTDLDLTQNLVGADGLVALGASPHLTRLRRLVLRENPVTDRGTSALLQAPWLEHLEHLDLRGCYLSSATASAIAATTHLTKLRHLDLMNNDRLDADGCRALSDAPHLASLDTLLTSEPRASTSAAWLATSPFLAASIRDAHADGCTRKNVDAVIKALGLKVPGKLPKDAAIERVRELRAASW